MVEKLLGALAKSVRDAFEEKVEVYTESVHQGVVKPCFFVQCEECERVEMLNRNFFVRVHVALTYDNDGDEKRYDAQCITAKLFDLLGVVRVGENFFNGRKIHGRWEDGKMVVRVCYDMWCAKMEEDCELIEKIEVRGMCDGERIYEG